MRLQDLINELTEAGVNYKDIEDAIRKLKFTSPVINDEQEKQMRAVLGVSASASRTQSQDKHPKVDNKAGGLAEAPPTNIEESAQQIHTREVLSQQTLQRLQQQYAAITGQQDAIHEENLKITQQTAYNATRLELRLAEIQRQKEMILATQANPDINSFLADLGIANPLTVCTSAITVAEESLSAIEQLHREKKS